MGVYIANPALRRALRTFFQAFLGIVLGSVVLTGVTTNGTVDLDALQKVLVSALGAGIVALLAFVQNALEDSAGSDGLIVKKK